MDILDVKKKIQETPLRHTIQQRIKDDSPTIEATAIAIVNNENISAILKKADFPPSALKVLTALAADRPMAIRELTKKHSWLARVPITPTGLTILHFAITERLPNFTELLKVESIVDNLNPIDMEGQTPIMTACKEGRRIYFNELLQAGAKVDVMTFDMETIYHFITDNSESEEMLYDLYKRKRCINLPDVEVRRRVDNKTALQLALAKRKTGTARCLMRYFSASASTLYGISPILNTADMVFFKFDERAVDVIDECTGTEPSLTRVAFAILDEKVPLGSFTTGWLDRWLNKKIATSYLKKRGTYQKYETNATKSEALGSTSSDTDTECGVCLESMDDHHLTVCSHRFHPKCLNVWLSYRSMCPMCRSSDVTPVPPVTGSPLVLPDRPDTPPLNQRPVIEPSLLDQPYPSRLRLGGTQRYGVGNTYTYKDLPFEDVEYLIGGIWKCESDIY
nr:MAG: wsv199-like protein [Marsupenaeus japonicus pemonivirus]